MFEELEKLTSSTMDTITSDQADDEFERMKKEPLLDGVPPDDVSKRITHMLRDVNPYMSEPKGEKGLVKWIIEQMPPSYGDLIESTMQNLERVHAHLVRRVHLRAVAAPRRRVVPAARRGHGRSAISRDGRARRRLRREPL